MTEQTKLIFDAKEFYIKESIRSLLIFEELTGKKAAEISDNLTDTLTLFYCFLRANNKDTFNYTFENFIDLIDVNESAVNSFVKFIELQAIKNAKNGKSVKKKK